MKILKNKEFKRNLILILTISLIAVLISFIWNTAFGLFMLLILSILISIFVILSKSRYNKISALSNDINELLHGNENINLQSYSEGEISILQSEIYKLTVKLTEQKELLKNEKIFLADSLADISHQLRTPLTSANILISLLSEPDISNEKRLELVQKLTGILRRMDWLIVTLLKISKLDADTVELKKENLDFKKLIEISCDQIIIPMEIKEQKLNIKAHGTLNCDINWTAEAISNVLKNCMEHTPIGGSIEINSNENPIYSELVIKDSGNGFNKKDLNHIFERFYRGDDSSGQSFGIGLSLAKIIINKQNGTIKAKNSKFGGAEFTIRFYK